MSTEEKLANLYKIDNKAMILLASDIHIGALRTELSLFNDFLKKIIGGLKSGYFKDLKALIILGDCFDKIMENYEEFYEIPEYNEILNNFNILHNYDDFKLIFTLGNHEVSVKDDYDCNFYKEKSDFLDEFKEVNNRFNADYSFLNREQFSQYAILKKPNVGDPEINLYDTKKQIADNEGTPIQLKVRSQSNESKNILLTHGFQFDPHLGFFSKIWDLALKVKSQFIKDLADRIWNGFFKEIYNQGRRLRDFFLKDPIRPNEEGEELIDTATNYYLDTYEIVIDNVEKRNVQQLIENKYKSDKHRDDFNDNSFNKKLRKKFLPELGKLGYKKDFNYIIYGHTHRRWPRPFSKEGKESKYQRYYKFKDTILFNTGAWQHVDLPSFIQIDNNWKFNTVDIERAINQVRVILDKPPSKRLVEEMLRRRELFEAQERNRMKQAKINRQEPEDSDLYKAE